MLGALGQNKCTFRTIPASRDWLNLARTRATGPLVRVAIRTVNNNITRPFQSSPPNRRGLRHAWIQQESSVVTSFSNVST